MSVVLLGSTSGSVTLQEPAVAGNSVLTLPAVTDTLAGIAATQTLTNKTLTSPTLTTPALGTPTSGVLTNCTGLPQAGLASNVAGNGPAFSIYASSTTSVPTATYTKVIFAGTEFDTTGGMVASSRFTPTVAGYYYITGSAYYASGTYEHFVQVNKNGTELKRGTDFAVATYSRMVNCLVYLNGSTDYVEIFTYQASGSTINVLASSSQTFFQGFLARAA